MSEKSFYNKIRSQRHTADGLHLAPVGRRVSQPRGRIVWLWFRPRAGRPLFPLWDSSAEERRPYGPQVTGSIPVPTIQFHFFMRYSPWERLLLWRGLSFCQHIVENVWINTRY